MRRLAAFLFAALLTSQCFAALPATFVGEVQTGGTDTFGGWFSSARGGVDKSLTTSAYRVVDGVTNTGVVQATTTTILITGFSVDDVDDPGNALRITGGTATAGLYEIVSADEGANTWTLDRSAGTAAQTVVGNVGGCLATPGRAAADATVSGMKAWVKTGTYTISTSTPGSAGPVLFASGINAIMEGYSATRGDLAATPTLDAGAQTGVNLFAGQGTAHQLVISMKADCQAGASNKGFVSANIRNSFIKCIAFDCTTGFDGTSGNRASAIQCFADTCSTAGFADFNATLCVAKSCGNGFANAGQVTTSNCLAYSCTTDGFVATTNGIAFKNCTADGNGQYGFNLGAATSGRAFNCLATNHSGGGDAGFSTGVANQAYLINCAGYNNTADKSGTFFRDAGFVTVSSDPYINQAGGDFRPNRRSGGGLMLMKAGLGVYGQTDYKVIGALDFSPYIGTR